MVQEGGESPKAGISSLVVPDNIQNSSKANIRTRLDDSIRQHAITSILSESPVSIPTNTPNVQQQQHVPQTDKVTITNIDAVGMEMFKWATEKFIINKNAEFIHFEPRSVRFLHYLRAAGEHNIANAIENDASVTTTIDWWRRLCSVPVCSRFRD